MPRGNATRGDVLTMLSDGTDLGQLWNEFSEALDLAKTNRTAISSRFTFQTTRGGGRRPPDHRRRPVRGGVGVRPAERVRLVPKVLTLGYTFRWYDLGSRYTWMLLVDAPVEEARALHNAALAADNRMVYNANLRSLMDPTPRLNREGRRSTGCGAGTGWPRPPTTGWPSTDRTPTTWSRGQQWSTAGTSALSSTPSPSTATATPRSAASSSSSSTPTRARTSPSCAREPW
jgi:hypothetical protein